MAIADHLNADEIETALRTLAEQHENDGDADLSERQVEVTNRVHALWHEVDGSGDDEAIDAASADERRTNLTRAVEQVKAALQGRFDRENPVGERGPFAVDVILWPASGLDDGSDVSDVVGVRVAEVGFSNYNGGVTWLQSDQPHGTAICALTERAIIECYFEGELVDEAIADLLHAAFGKSEPEAPATASVPTPVQTSGRPLLTIRGQRSDAIYEHIGDDLDLLREVTADEQEVDLFTDLEWAQAVYSNRVEIEDESVLEFGEQRGISGWWVTKEGHLQHGKVFSDIIFIPQEGPTPILAEALAEASEQPKAFPQTPEEARTCVHGNRVWFGHECGLCDSEGEHRWAAEGDKREQGDMAASTTYWIVDQEGGTFAFHTDVDAHEFGRKEAQGGALDVTVGTFVAAPGMALLDVAEQACQQGFTRVARYSDSQQTTPAEQPEPDADDLNFARESLGDHAPASEVWTLAEQRVAVRLREEGERPRPEPYRMVGVAGSPLLSDHGIVEVSPDLVLYEKCLHCHLFIEVNDAALDDNGQPIPGVLLFIHLHSGDGPDEALDESHDAWPSGRLANLLTWKTYGPEAMRERFTD